MSDFKWSSEENRNKHIEKHIFGDKAVSKPDYRNKETIEYEVNKWNNLFKSYNCSLDLPTIIKNYQTDKKKNSNEKNGNDNNVFNLRYGKVCNGYQRAIDDTILSINNNIPGYKWYKYTAIDKTGVEEYHSYNAVCLREGDLYDTLQVCVKKDKEASSKIVSCFFKNNIRSEQETKYAVLNLHNITPEKILEIDDNLYKNKTKMLTAYNKCENDSNLYYMETNDELLQRSFAYASSYYSFDSIFNEEQNLDIPKSDFIKHYFDYFYWQLSNEEDVDQKEFYANLSQFLREGKLKNKDQTLAFKQQVKEKYESTLEEVNEMPNMADSEEAFDDDEVADELFVKLAEMTLLCIIINDKKSKKSSEYRYKKYFKFLKDGMLKKAIINFSNTMVPEQ